PAVGDDPLVAGHALALVQGLELVRRLERAVLVRGLRPRDVGGARDVPWHLRLLLGEVVRRELLATELLGRAHVDELDIAADARQHLLAQRADLAALTARDGEPGRLVRRQLLRQLPAL